MNADQNQAKAIFLEAAEKHDPDRWPAFLDRACASRPDLRRRVEELLEAHRVAGTAPHQAGAEGPAPAPLEVSGSVEHPGSVIGPYKLLQQIGEGGMGTVFMAEQTQPVQRKVALKLVKSGMDSRQVIARFEAERQALALMDHPNIAKVLDAGTTDSGRPYFVMELVKGVPITKYCDERHLTPRERLELFVPVCQAVQHAHQKGIIHRDLKPSNVMVCLYDGKPVPKVIDFGIAKAAGPKLTEKTLFTELGQVVGTLEYMSPEQAELNQLDVDTRSDIYSLGVLLYELLTGTTPLERKRFQAVAFLEVLRLIREEESPRPSTRLGTTEGLPSIAANRGLEPKKLSGLMRGELDWIVMKTLDKDRNRRYETASGVAADVQRYLDDEAVEACPPSALYRFRKFARRNRAILAIALVSMLAALFVVGSTGWAVRDRAARNAALDDEVRRTLDEAAAQIEDAKWPEALAAVQRADMLLTAGGRLERPARLLDLQNDVDMAQRLEDVYSRPKTEEFLWGQDLDAAYAEAFAAAGIDVAALPVAEAAELIRARGIRRELTRALDVWSHMRKRAGIRRAPGWKQLLEIAEAADPDPWRNQLRQARKGGDRKALEALADSANSGRLPPETLLQLATALYESGGTDQAMALLRQAHLQYAQDWWINDLLGWYCLTARPPQYDEAIRYYTAARAVRPQNPYTLHAIGRGLLGKKASAEAVVVFSRAIELKPDYSDAWFKRGEAFVQLGQGDKAVADVSHGIESNPKSAGTWLSAGVAYYEIGRQDEAIAAYKEAIRLEPDYALAHNNLGVSLREKGLLDEAIAACKEAVRLEPDYALAHNNLGIALRRKGLLDEAIAAYKEAIRLGREDAYMQFDLGEAHACLGQWDEAAADFATAFDLKEPQRAMLWLEHACLRLQSEDVEGYHQLCSRMRERFGPSKAADDIALLTHACALAPNVQGDAERVLQLAEQRLALNPSTSGHRHVWSVHVLGLAYYRAGQYDKAVACLKKSLTDHAAWEHHVLNWLVLAMAEQRLGHAAEAKEYLDKANNWIGQKMRNTAKASDRPAPPGWEWRDWLMVQLFRREAEALIAGKK